jgi:hypothetical protein
VKTEGKIRRRKGLEEEGGGNEIKEHGSEHELGNSADWVERATIPSLKVERGWRRLEPQDLVSAHRSEDLGKEVERGQAERSLALKLEMGDDASRRLPVDS